MKIYDTIFLDRDGTLNPDPGYISSLDQFQLFDFTIPALQLLSKCTPQFCIVTNQSGVSRGLIRETDLQRIHAHLAAELRRNKIPLVDIFVCTDHPDQVTTNRKPGPGLYLQAAEKYGLNLKASLMIGDTRNDLQAGRSLGMDTMLVLTGNGTATLRDLRTAEQPTYVTENLLTGAKLLTEEIC